MNASGQLLASKHFGERWGRTGWTRRATPTSRNRHVNPTISGRAKENGVTATTSSDAFNGDKPYDHF